MNRNTLIVCIVSLVVGGWVTWLDRAKPSTSDRLAEHRTLVITSYPEKPADTREGWMVGEKTVQYQNTSTTPYLKAVSGPLPKRARLVTISSGECIILKPDPERKMLIILNSSPTEICVSSGSTCPPGACFQISAGTPKSPSWWSTLATTGFAVSANAAAIIRVDEW